jgi:outer membrane protein OmpA-like peptidoglycan-associated protein
MNSFSPIRFLLKTTAILLLLYSLIGFFILPGFFTRAAPLFLAEKTGHTINIGNTNFNPYNLVITISNLAIFHNSEGDRVDSQPLLTIDKLRLDLDAASLLKRAFICREMLIDGLFIHFIRQPGSDRALAKLLDHLPGQNGRKISYSLENIFVQNSAIIFEDPLNGTYQHAEQISLALPVLSNLPKPEETGAAERDLVRPEFSAIINGIPTTSAGKIRTVTEQPNETSFDLVFNNIDLAVLTSYLPLGDLLVEQGLMDINLTAFLSVNRAGNPSILLEGDGSINEMRTFYGPAGSALLGRASFSIKIKPLSDLWQLTRISLQNAYIGHPDLGEIEAPQLLISGLNYSRKDHQLTLGRISGAAAKVTIPASGTSATKAVATDGLTFAAGSLELKNSEIVIQNFGDDLLVLDRAEIHATELSSSPASSRRLVISSTVNGKGSLKLAGKASLDPLAGELQFQAREIPIISLRPILALFTPPSLHKGLVSGSGKLSFPNLVVEGSATVADIEADISPGRSFLKCATMAMDNFKLSPAGRSLVIEKLAFNKPAFTATITDRKRPALAGFIFPAATDDSPDQPLIIARQVTVVDGSVTLADLTANPPIRIRIAALDSEMEKMLNRAGNQQPFSLQATLQISPEPAYFPSYHAGPTARIKMNGKVALFGDQPTLVSSLEIKAIDLTGLSPYLAPLIGYQPARGQLDLHTDILLGAHQLTTTNSLTIRGLQLGQSISGRFNTPLALALLTDRSDMVRIDFRTSNDLQNLNSSYFDSLAEKIRTILAKATTAPFDLLAGENRQTSLPEYFPFGPGKTEIANKDIPQLQKLTRILKDRPRLMITIIGRADAYTDFQEIKELNSGADQGKMLKDLAGARASVIRTALISAGVNGSRLQLDQPADPFSEEILLDDRPASRADITLQIAGAGKQL